MFNINKLFTFHISIDGLVPDTIKFLGKHKLPNLFRIRKHGLFTDNARTDNYSTKTLPNHISMFTNLSSNQHGVEFNFNKNDRNIHNGKYIVSIFDLLKRYGKRVGMYVGKEKFFFIDKSYSENTGIGNIDEIDIFCFNNDFVLKNNTHEYLHFSSDKPIIRNKFKSISIIETFMSDFKNSTRCDYNFIHFCGTDIAGHLYGWDSEQYKKALMAIDDEIGVILNLMDQTKDRTVLIITSDHGGHNFNHGDIDNKSNFTIPFYVYDSTKKYKNNDLYHFNKSKIEPSGDINPNNNVIRNRDVANLILNLYNIPPIGNLTYGVLTI